VIMHTKYSIFEHFVQITAVSGNNAQNKRIAREVMFPEIVLLGST